MKTLQSVISLLVFLFYYIRLFPSVWPAGMGRNRERSDLTCVVFADSSLAAGRSNQVATSVIDRVNPFQCPSSPIERLRRLTRRSTAEIRRCVSTKNRIRHEKTQ